MAFIAEELTAGLNSPICCRLSLANCYFDSQPTRTMLHCIENLPPYQFARESLNLGKVNALAPGIEDTTSNVAPTTKKKFGNGGFMGLTVNFDFIKSLFGGGTRNNSESSSEAWPGDAAIFDFHQFSTQKEAEDVGCSQRAQRAINCGHLPL